MRKSAGCGGGGGRGAGGGLFILENFYFQHDVQTEDKGTSGDSVERPALV